MADQADVETALASLVANALYPNGTAAAGAVANLCRVYRGFPTSPALDADLAAGAVNVSVAAANSPVKNVTRYPRVWRTVAPVPATLTVTVAAQTASFAGACAVGQLAGVAANGALFPYAVQASDTPATVASNLAALLRAAGWLVDYAGSTISVPGASLFTARVVNGAGALQEIKRQEQDFRISLWCPDPASRDAVARVVNGAGALQEIKRQEQDFRISLWCPDPASRDAVAPVIDEALAAQKFIALADGSYGRLIFSGSEAQDNAADATLYRRDLTYSVEYPTTLAQITPAMLFGTASFYADAAFVKNYQS